MFSFLNFLNWKSYLVLLALFIVIGFGIYVNHLKAEIVDRETKLETTSLKLKESNENNKKIIEAYEKTLAIERKEAEQKAITQEQKEMVITKYKTLVKEVEKRGEIKQDEKSNFTIVSF